MLDKVVQGLRLSYNTIQTIRFSEKTRNLWDLVNFALGFVGFHNLLEDYFLQDHEVAHVYQKYPEWQQTAFKISDFLSNISLVLGGITTRPAIAVWRWSAQVILSPQQLERFFGLNGMIPANKAYRVITILSFLLGVPATLKTIYVIYTWIHYRRAKAEKEKVENDDYKIYTPLPVRKEDVFVTMKTVSETAQHFLRSPHK